MTLFFSARTGGFYDTDIHGTAIPEDAVEIGPEDHAALLAAQAAGRRIVADDAGHPRAADPPARPLAELRAAAILAVDRAAEAERLRYITPGDGQAMVYQAKEAEARALQADPAPDPAAYPHLAAEVGITAADLAGVAAIVLATAARWRQVSAAIEGRRLAAKAGITAAADAAGVEAVLAALAWP